MPETIPEQEPESSPFRTTPLNKTEKQKAEALQARLRREYDSPIAELNPSNATFLLTLGWDEGSKRNEFKERISRGRERALPMLQSLQAYIDGRLTDVEPETITFVSCMPLRLASIDTSIEKEEGGRLSAISLRNEKLLLTEIRSLFREFDLSNPPPQRLGYE